MIERVAERRAAGDWRGACAAANVTVGFELRDVAREHGARVAETVEEDLLCLVPDLVRWHLPPALRDRSTIRPDRVLLAWYGPEKVGRPADRAMGPWLYVAPPRMVPENQRPTLKVVEAPQRLRLGFGSVWLNESYQDWTRARHLWDARRTGELLERWGGCGRPPFFHPDGTALAECELPTGPGPGPVERNEWITLLHERGHVDEAFAAVGIEFDPTRRGQLESPSKNLKGQLANLPLAVPRLVEELRLSGHRSVVLSGSVEFEDHDGKVWARPAYYYYLSSVRLLAEACWRRPPDLDLLRTGRMRPDDLHPLVHAALFPAAAAPSPPREPDPPSPFRVRCRGEWHSVGPDLSMPHDEAERRREHAFKALGGAITGCFAVEHAWITGTGRLPKAARELRRDLLARFQHGDTPGVVRLLDAGVDPRVRNGRGQTLLHLLHLLDHEPLLARLLAAGLDLEAADRRGRTPLHTAVGEQGTVALVKALLDAGARTDVTDVHGRSLAHQIRRFGRLDLRFLIEPPGPAE